MMDSPSLFGLNYTVLGPGVPASQVGGFFFFSISRIWSIYVKGVEGVSFLGSCDIPGQWPVQ